MTSDHYNVSSERFETIDIDFLFDVDFVCVCIAGE